jgi:hypothetical protein
VTRRRHRHWVVDVAIRARDEAIARDRAALGPLWPLAPVFRQIVENINTVFDALAAVFEQIGRTMSDVGTALFPPAPPPDPIERALWLRQHRGTGPDRQVQHRPRPRRHAQ